MDYQPTQDDLRHMQALAKRMHPYGGHPDIQREIMDQEMNARHLAGASFAWAHWVGGAVAAELERLARLDAVQGRPVAAPQAPQGGLFGDPPPQPPERPTWHRDSPPRVAPPGDQKALRGHYLEVHRYLAAAPGLWCHHQEVWEALCRLHGELAPQATTVARMLRKLYEWRPDELERREVPAGRGGRKRVQFRYVGGHGPRGHYADS